MIRGIEVKGLFGRFSYRLPLGEEKIAVLTGPNGAGKSTILSLVYALSTCDEEIVLRTPFNSIEFVFDEGKCKVEKVGGKLYYYLGEKETDGKSVARAIGKVKLIGKHNFFSALLTGEKELGEFIGKIRALPSEIKKAVGVFDERIEVFVNLLDERTEFKKPLVTAENGLEFIDEVTGEKLAFSQLSAGEVALCVFYYDILFGAEENSLLLIDEPETSLHIVWQFTLIDDLYETLSLIEGARAIVSTHSPQVLSRYRELQVDLGEQYEG